jgi:hypothetical protein
LLVLERAGLIGWYVIPIGKALRSHKFIVFFLGDPLGSLHYQQAAAARAPKYGAKHSTSTFGHALVHLGLEAIATAAALATSKF